MIDLTQDEQFQLNLIESLIRPRIAPEGCKRCRSCPTKIKFLYHIYQLEKKVARGEWIDIHQRKESLALGAKICKTSITDFITDEDCGLFLEVQRRPKLLGKKFFQSNIYRLKPWVIRIFKFFEISGMMQGFRKDYNAWKKKFEKRFSRWLIPNMLRGKNISDLVYGKRVMNKFTNKSTVKMAAVGVPNVVGIKYPTDSTIKPSGSISNIEDPPPVFKEFSEIGRVLKDRFSLRMGDINQLMGKFSVDHHKRAIRLGEQWLQNGLNPLSSVRVYQACLNQTSSKNRRL